MIKKVLKDRKDKYGKVIGNCFSTCITAGCQISKDINLKFKKKPEIVIFPIEVLKDLKYEIELSVALKYLTDNSYIIHIIDPGPLAPWGKSLSKCLVEERNYETVDVLNLIKDEFIVVISTINLSDNSPHAVLVTQSGIYDPLNDDIWAEKQKIDNLEEYSCRKIERFLIAFKPQKKSES